MEAPSQMEFGLRGEEVVQEGLIDLNRGVGLGVVGEAWDLAGSDELLRRPDIVWCGSC